MTGEVQKVTWSPAEGSGGGDVRGSFGFCPLVGQELRELQHLSGLSHLPLLSSVEGL